LPPSLANAPVVVAQRGPDQPRPAARRTRTRSEVFKLFHGTTVEGAVRIRSQGFRGVDPADAVRDLELHYGVDPGTARGMEFGWAVERYNAGDVSFSTGWGDASRYARRCGSEAVWQALHEIGRRLVGGDEATVAGWVAAQPKPSPAVVTVEATLDQIAAAATYHPDITRERLERPDLPDEVVNAADEIILAAPVPAEWVVAVDALGPCVCAGSLHPYDVCQACRHPLDPD
jgi:hypothetical protein